MTETKKQPTMNVVKKPALDQDVADKMKKTFGVDLAELMTSRLPGVGPKTSPTGYTSEKELRERVYDIIKRPPKKLTADQMALVGIDMDKALTETFNKQKKKELTPTEKVNLADRWLERLIAAARKRGRLMSDQQLSDWRIGRKLGEGDRARYIGPGRNEVTHAHLIVPREPGQTGIITSVKESKTASTLIVFHPDEPVMPVEASEQVDKQYVDLLVREHTPGWLYIERIPENE